MKITAVNMRLVEREKVKAFASITIDDEFVVHDLRIVQGEKGLFVAMPSRRLPNGEFRDVAHPIKSEVREMIQKAVLEEFETQRAMAPAEAAPEAGMAEAAAPPAGEEAPAPPAEEAPAPPAEEAPAEEAPAEEAPAGEAAAEEEAPAEEAAASEEPPVEEEPEEVAEEKAREEMAEETEKKEDEPQQ